MVLARFRERLVDLSSVRVGCVRYWTLQRTLRKVYLDCGQSIILVVSAKDLFVEIWRMLKVCRSKFRPRFVI